MAFSVSLSPGTLQECIQILPPVACCPNLEQLLCLKTWFFRGHSGAKSGLCCQGTTKNPSEQALLFEFLCSLELRNQNTNPLHNSM